MSRDVVPVRTKLAPPRAHRRVLPRPALMAKLRDALDYRLTLVQAGTGYGKSTALAALVESEALPHYVWYSVSEADADPQHFLSYLVEAFRLRLPELSDAPLAMLHEVSADGDPGAWSQVVDVLVNALVEAVHAPLLLILDDYHFTANSPEVNALGERFIAYLPPDVHVLVSTRTPLHGQALTAWRAKGEVLDLSRDDFVFQPAEIVLLFRDTYGMQLAPDDIALLAHKTEGWPIALQLVWQGLRHNPALRVPDLLMASPGEGSLGALFDYLANDVVNRQPPEIQTFLHNSAVLRELTPAACAAVTPAAESESAAMLRRLHELGQPGQHYRYHHLFHDFLGEQLAADPAAAREQHRRAAEYFRAESDYGEAIYHGLAAQAYPEAAAAIEIAGEAALQAGRLDTVARWIDALPPETLLEHPRLQVYLGDVYRLRSRFDEALRWYVEAERIWRARLTPAGVSQALRGQALVYLDTVQPAQAEHLLQEALRLSDGMADRQAQARLLELLAENKLNMGKPDEAERLRAEAMTLREEGPTEDVLSVRVKLRTGQLDEAQRILETWFEAERREAEQGQVHPPRSHRETVLLLSLIHAFQGRAEPAFTLAQEGIALAEKLSSPFTTAVAHIRLGHAWQLLPADAPQVGEMRGGGRAEAIRCYQVAIALGDQLAVRRMRAEALWGLTRAYGYFGDLESARHAAAEGVEIARAAGDLWIAALIELALGASLVLAGKPAEASEVFIRVLTAFRDCGDSFGRAATRLWLGLAYLDLRQGEHFASCIDDCLTLCEMHGYDSLFLLHTLLGLPDPRRAVPLLIEAQARHRRPAYAARLLAAIGLSGIALHPGYQLRVQTLGAFRLWRGEVEVDPREWKRDKARQLFQLFLTRRGRLLQREEITDLFWPTLPSEAADRNFKVALSALNKALEPVRPADAPSAYIAREGSAYFLRPGADLRLDAADFEQACKTGLRPHTPPDAAIHHLQAALHLYGGDYLPDALYDEWVSAERERLLTLYLRAADRLAGLLLERGQVDESLVVCQAILARDSCWERAYRLMMAAHARQGNRPQALQVYQRCVAALRAELDVSPSPATVALHDRIAQAGEISLADV
jgi:DNA-binding SARP family transcriptional activator